MDTHDHSSHSHSHDHGGEHGHTHEQYNGPGRLYTILISRPNSCLRSHILGSFVGREQPIISGRDWTDRAYTIGIGGYVFKMLACSSILPQRPEQARQSYSHSPSIFTIVSVMKYQNESKITKKYSGPLAPAKQPSCSPSAARSPNASP